MRSSGIPFVSAALLSGLLLAGLAPTGRAQFNPAPASPYQPPARTEAAARVSSQPSGFTAPPAVTVSGPSYNYRGYQGAAGGYLSGGADVINAQGNYRIQTQQSNLTREQVQSAKIDNQRKRFDEAMYERANTPTLEDERERARMEQFRRSRNDPPITEIWSGKALNDLLLPCQQLQGMGARGPTVPLDGEVLRRINVTTGTNPAGLGILKDAGQFQWPVALRRGPYEKERKKVDDLALKAVKEAQYGQVNAGTVTELNKSLDRLMSTMKSNISETDANEYIRGKRYLNEISSAVSTLDDPHVAKYVNRGWAAKGNNVGELVAQMTAQGLKFAPAASGDQSAYTVLHRAMVNYEGALGQMAGR